MSCDDDVTVRRELRVDVPPEDVWREVVDLGWLADGDLDLHPGARGWLRDDDGTLRRAEVDELVPGRRVVFRWWPVDGPESEVSVTVAPDGDGARVRVVERPAGVPSAFALAA